MVVYAELCIVRPAARPRPLREILRPPLLRLSGTCVSARLPSRPSPSFTVLDSTSISLLWFTVSKQDCKSMLTTQTYPSLIYFLHLSSASCAPLPGRNPKLLSENCSSYKGVSSCAIACWITLSTTVGIPSFLVLPFSSLGILDLCQYFGHKKLKVYADFSNSSSSFCCGVI